MKLIEKKAEIKKNMETLDTYLNGQNEEEYFFATRLIKKGRCFIAVKGRNGYQFYPSRFVGYVNNTMNGHILSNEKDGRETNKVIHTALKQGLQENTELEKAYLNYCQKLNLEPEHHKRKYWEWLAW